MQRLDANITQVELSIVSQSVLTALGWDLAVPWTYLDSLHDIQLIRPGLYSSPLYSMVPNCSALRTQRDLVLGADSSDEESDEDSSSDYSSVSSDTALEYLLSNCANVRLTRVDSVAAANAELYCTSDRNTVRTCCTYIGHV